MLKATKQWRRSGLPLALKVLARVIDKILQITVQIIFAGHDEMECHLSTVPEWRMTHVMPERYGLGEILVESKRGSYGPAYLRDLHGVCQACANMIASP